MIEITNRHRLLCTSIREAAERAGVAFLKTDNRVANLGLRPSLALAVQLAKIIDGETKLTEKPDGA